MALMARYPDKAFDLAIVDPPYGIGMDKGKNGINGSAEAAIYDKKSWDKAPEKIYFSELFRISNYQIIWGGNYFIEYINKNSSCWILWNKQKVGNYYADFELAWTNFSTAARMFTFRWHGMLQGDMKNKEQRIHPTQKPVALYKWLLSRYAQPGWKILDTHMGSGSIAIACHDLGYNLTACELDKDYYEAAMERIRIHQAQGVLDFAEADRA
jgi:site-specific DNA-methyltransferase (adenine-specific)